MTRKKYHTVATFDNGLQVQAETTGWHERYCLYDKASDKRTGLGEYQHLFTMHGKVAVSPYYTDHNNWVLVSAEEAIQYVAIGAK